MRYSISFAVFVSVFSVQGFCAKQENETLVESLPASRLIVRHLEPKGIGYDQGYTTLELFFAPRSPWEGVWVPFLDLRGHLFDNGTNKAANAGLGLRYLDRLRKRIWGVNAYYDYHNTKYQYYNQVALGLEWLGKIWDARLNGYLPVGNKKSGFFTASFGRFSGHSMLLSREYEFAMKGVNAEVGLHVDHFKHAPLYFAAGPYYLNGRGRAAFGGEVRAVVDLFNVLRLEGNASYDHIFKWIGQGQIGLTFALGRKYKQKPCSLSACSSSKTLVKRSTQRVDRFEIIPIKDPAKLTPAINPATGQPYVFWFVNNTSLNSQGTIDAPFNTLIAAQNASSANQNIYVFPGDGTGSGMNAGVMLQDGQSLLGASIQQNIPTTVGSITIPSMASSLPSIANTSGDVVGVANNNTISGFLISVIPSHNLILNTGAIDSLTVVNNEVSLLVGNDANGVYNQGVITDLNFSMNHVSAFGHNNNAIRNSGTIGVLNSSGNVVDGSLATGTSHIISGGFIAALSSLKDVFVAIPGAFTNSGTINSFYISKDAFSGIGVGQGVKMNFGTIRNAQISNCTFSGITTGQGIRYLKNSSSSDSLEITNNTFSGSSPSAGYAATIEADGGSLCLELTGNYATPSDTPAAYQFTQTNGGVFNRTNGSDSSTNIGQFSTSGTIGNSGSCSLP